MFTGNFLNKNIGHEVINLFADDVGNNFIYLCKDGAFNRSDIDLGNSYVVQVQRPQKTVNTLEVISVAIGLTLVDNNFSEKNPAPTYGGAKVTDIFANNVKLQNRYLTFLAKRIFVPKTPIFIYHGNGCKDNMDMILNEYNPSQFMREYILEGDSGYEELLNMMPVSKKNIDNKWQKRKTSESKVTKGKCVLLATDIYGIQTRELSYSNALGYYIKEYPDLFRDFFESIIYDKKGTYDELPSEKPLIYREWKNIDIIVNWGKYVFVIENKIRSGINGVQSNGKTQLDKYIEVMEEAITNNSCAFCDKTPIYIFLTPNHNDIEITNGEWIKIRYSQLVEVLKNKISKVPFKQDYLLQDFFDALRDQASNNLNACIMKRKFKCAIQYVKK